MNLRRLCLTVSAALAIAAVGMLGVAIAQNQGGAAGGSGANSNGRVLPIWAYPVNQGRGSGGGFAGRGNRGPGGAGAPGGAAPSAPGGAPGAAGAGRGPGRAPLDNVTEKHVPGSTAGYTAAYIADLFTVPDWFPDSHPQMPDVVAHGDRQAMVPACGYCHWAFRQSQTPRDA